MNTPIDNKINLALCRAKESDQDMSNIKTNLGFQLGSVIAKKLRPIQTDSDPNYTYTATMYVFTESELEAYVNSVMKLSKR